MQICLHYSAWNDLHKIRTNLNKLHLESLHPTSIRAQLGPYPPYATVFSSPTRLRGGGCHLSYLSLSCVWTLHQQGRLTRRRTPKQTEDFGCLRKCWFIFLCHDMLNFSFGHQMNGEEKCSCAYTGIWWPFLVRGAGNRESPHQTFNQSAIIDYTDQDFWREGRGQNVSTLLRRFVDLIEQEKLQYSFMISDLRWYNIFYHSSL